MSDRPSMLRRHHSPDCDYSQTAERGGSASRAEVNDHGSKVLAIVALIMAAISIGVVFMVPALIAAKMDNTADIAKRAERETKLAREDIRVLQVSMAANGLNTDEHQVGRKAK